MPETDGVKDLTRHEFYSEAVVPYHMSIERNAKSTGYAHMRTDGLRDYMWTIRRIVVSESNSIYLAGDKLQIQNQFGSAGTSRTLRIRHEDEVGRISSRCRQHEGRAGGRLGRAPNLTGPQALATLTQGSMIAHTAQACGLRRQDLCL